MRSISPSPRDCKDSPDALSQVSACLSRRNSMALSRAYLKQGLSSHSQLCCAHSQALRLVLLSPFGEGIRIWARASSSCSPATNEYGRVLCPRLSRNCAGPSVGKLTSCDGVALLYAPGVLNYAYLYIYGMQGLSVGKADVAGHRPDRMTTELYHDVFLCTLFFTARIRHYSHIHLTVAGWNAKQLIRGNYSHYSQIDIIG
ncbi:hypothetical protein PENSPDRAFT_215233 [Peniophora sp. CONT]|nr:hypothetical protein PENSPDRAFT_215233 [Peniophora sp. CONT]